MSSKYIILELEDLSVSFCFTDFWDCYLKISAKDFVDFSEHVP